MKKYFLISLLASVFFLMVAAVLYQVPSVAAVFRADSSLPLDQTQTDVLGTKTVSSDQMIRDMLSQSGVVFPVRDLGNCRDIASCRKYCDDLDHVDACFDFAQKYGLIGRGDGASEINMRMLISESERVLGCSTVSGCKEKCDKNPQQCKQIKYKLETSLTRIRQGILIGKARRMLGCTNFLSCHRACETNKEACTEFVREFRLVPSAWAYSEDQ